MNLDNLINLELVKESNSIRYGRRYRFEAVTESRFYEYIFRHSFNGSTHLTVTEISHGRVLNSKSGRVTVKDEIDSMEDFILDNLSTEKPETKKTGVKA